MTDVNPVSQGTSPIVQDPRQLDMRDLAPMIRSFLDMMNNINLLSSPHPDMPLGNVQTKVVVHFEAAPTEFFSHGHDTSPFVPIGNISGSTPNILNHPCRFLKLH